MYVCAYVRSLVGLQLLDAAAEVLRLEGNSEWGKLQFDFDAQAHAIESAHTTYERALSSFQRTHLEPLV
jgi:hypothetical protein